MEHVQWIKEILESLDDDGNAFALEFNFESVIKDIKRNENDNEELKKIRKYIKDIDHPLYDPLYNYSFWIEKREYKEALKAAEKLCENAIDSVEKSLFLFAVTNFKLAVGIYASLGNAYSSELESVIKEVVKAIEQIFGKKEYRWSIELLELISSKRKYLDKDDLQKILSIIDESSKYFDVQNNMHIVRSFLNLKIEFLKSERSEAEIIKVLEEIASTYEKDAKLREKEPLVVATFLKSAMIDYEKAGNKEKVTELKLKIKEAMEKAEFPVISFKVKLPKELIDSFTKSVSELEPDEMLIAIGSNPSFVPTRLEVMKLTEDILKEHPIQAIFPVTTVSNGNEVKSSISEDEIKEQRYRSEYARQIDYMGNVLELIFNQLIEKEKLDPELVNQYLNKNEIFDEDDIKTVKRGIEKFLDGDYISAIHILVPKIENIIRSLMLKVGIPTTIRDLDGIREGDLSSYLRRSEVEEMFGPDFNDFLRAFLTEKDAKNLRNRLAHGLVKYNEFNGVNASIALFVLLKIGTLQLIEKEPLENT